MVLHVRCVTGCGGGPEKTILNSPRFLATLGYKSRCVYLHPPGDLGFRSIADRGKLARAGVIGFEDRGPWDIRTVVKLVRLCQRRKVAIWHAHDYKTDALGILVRRFWPMKLVTTVHGWGVLTGKTPLYNHIDKFCLPFYDQVLCVSTDIYNECVGFGVAKTRCHLIHNAIDVEDYRRVWQQSQAKRNFSNITSGRIIGAMGRLSAEKGFDVLIKAVGKLVNAGHDVGLCIAGEGEERKLLEQLIVELGLRDKVCLLGHIENTKTFFEAIDVFALSSLREGLPNVLLEAMAMEVPVAATRIAGVPSLVTDGRNGLLVEPNDVGDMANGLERLLTDDGLRKSLRCAARTTIEKDFSFQRRMEKVADIYDRLLTPSSLLKRSFCQQC